MYILIHSVYVSSSTVTSFFLQVFYCIMWPCKDDVIIVVNSNSITKFRYIYIRTGIWLYRTRYPPVLRYTSVFPSFYLPFLPILLSFLLFPSLPSQILPSCFVGLKSNNNNPKNAVTFWLKSRYPITWIQKVYRVVYEFRIFTQI